jgi:hypothetical protein
MVLIPKEGEIKDCKEQTKKDRINPVRHPPFMVWIMMGIMFVAGVIAIISGHR